MLYEGDAKNEKIIRIIKSEFVGPIEWNRKRAFDSEIGLATKRHARRHTDYQT